MISKTKYHSLALEGIEDFEVLHKHPILPDGLQLPLLHGRRYRWMMNALSDDLRNLGYFVPGAETGDAAKVVSIGCVPGSFDRILKAWFNEKIHIFGVGLSVTEDFKKAFLGKVYDQIFTVEMDPLHPQNLASKYSETIPLGDGEVDVVVAGEIFEHLYSPLHFLKEVNRVLKPSGSLILTTPNICYIGNLIKLATGRSCYENLETSHIYLNSEWRAHIRVYDRHELALLCGRSGFKELYTKFLDNGEGEFYASARTRLKMKLMNLAFVVPMFRNNLCQVYHKTK